MVIGNDTVPAYSAYQRLSYFDINRSGSYNFLLNAYYAVSQNYTQYMRLVDSNGNVKFTCSSSIPWDVILGSFNIELTAGRYYLEVSDTINLSSQTIKIKDCYAFLVP